MSNIGFWEESHRLLNVPAVKFAQMTEARPMYQLADINTDKSFKAYMLFNDSFLRL